MTRTNLENLLNEKGLTVTKIANELGVASVTIYDVLKGRTTSRRIEAVLQEIFEEPISEIQKAWNRKTKESVDIKGIVERANREYRRVANM